MTSLNNYIDELLSCGQACFSREEALASLDLSAAAFIGAAGRLIKKRRLASPRRGFYLILRPEDRVSGAPDPVRWIDPLMKYLGLDYRLSLLRAAAFHGSSHQAVMAFQVITPRQLRPFNTGRHRLQFIYQSPSICVRTNTSPEWLAQIKSESGFTKVAGVELTLLDCARYFHRATGISGVAQIAKDLGADANPRNLAKIALAYENSTVRRLGYLLEYMGHTSQANALESFAKKAKSMKFLDPSIKPMPRALGDLYEHKKDTRWALEINEPVEIDF